MLLQQMKAPTIVHLMMYISHCAFGAVLLAPALPDISAYFQVAPHHTVLIITIYLLGYALGQLVYGPVTSALGRKPALQIGFLVTLLGCVLSIYAYQQADFHLFVFSRFITAIGATAGFTVCFAIIGDVYDSQQAQSIISSILLVFAIVPGVANFVGGFLVKNMSWIDTLWLFLAYTLILSLMTLPIPETMNPSNRRPIIFKSMLQSYATMFKQPAVMLNGLLFGLMVSFFYLFAQQGPFIGITTLGLHPDTYGMLAVVPYCGVVLGTFVFKYAIRHTDSRRLTNFGILMICLSVLLFMTTFVLMHFVSIVILLLCVGVTMFGAMFIIPIATGSGMNSAEDKSYASAVMNFMSMITVVGMNSLVSIPNYTPTLLPKFYLLTAILMIAVMNWARRTH